MYTVFADTRTFHFAKASTDAGATYPRVVLRNWFDEPTRALPHRKDSDPLTEGARTLTP
jgi:hypothetical protein